MPVRVVTFVFESVSCLGNHGTELCLSPGTPRSPVSLLGGDSRKQTLADHTTHRAKLAQMTKKINEFPTGVCWPALRPGAWRATSLLGPQAVDLKPLVWGFLRQLTEGLNRF